MEYTNYAKNGAEPVDGFILQAPISDRDGIDQFFPTWQTSLDFADKWIAEGKADWCMPRDLVPAVLGAPITAYRLRSLLAKEYVPASAIVLGQPDLFRTAMRCEIYVPV